MKTKSNKTSSGKFDYSALKNVANEHERDGRWAEAAAVWTTIATQSPNKMIIDNAKRRAKAALANAQAASDDTQATHHVVAGRDGAPIDVVVPGRESDTPADTAHAGATGAPVGEAASTPPRSTDGAHTGEPDANVAQPDPAAPAPAVPAPKPARDLPPVGTVIQKRDRKGELRCECKVVDGGIDYKGTTYKSLSAAALAASKDLGLGASTLDGWSWWGLKTRDTQPAPKKNATASLDRAFTKFRAKAEAIVKAATDDDRPKVLSAIRAHGAALLTMVEPTESAGS